ncbi:voltage-gated hydrogen channel 1 [Engraulis encrasicolus]|uniref:voltage-gated hydrogen channel 1 n=1 Tax=Engraulis encrasicolus TaxID=184585 RepID=UPI002FCF13C3
MTRYLRFFTAVGDKHEDEDAWQDETLHEASEELEPATGLHPQNITCRDALRRLYSSYRFQIAVVCLVILDAVFVLCELLLDFSAEVSHDSIAPQVFHYLSLSLLTFFMVELAGKIFAFRLEFFKHYFEVFDGVVVVVSFVLDIVYITNEGAVDGMGLLILFRLWRVARIINGIIMSVKNRAGHQVTKMKESNDRLVQRINELQEKNKKMEEENSQLRSLLQQHGIQI